MDKYTSYKFGFLDFSKLPTDIPINKDNASFVLDYHDYLMKGDHDIWMEGYRATGEHGTAQLIGRGNGNTFEEVIQDYMRKDPEHGIRRTQNGGYAIWACELFDNEEDARKAFG